MRTVFTNATLLDATGAAPRPGMAVLVAEGRIAWIGPASEAQPPEGARVVDLGGNTLMPGLIDVHMHITQGAVPDPIAEFTETVPFMALRGAAQAAILLDSGYTTMRNLGAFGYSDVAIREAVNQGLARGPRMLVSGEMVITEGSGERGYLRPEVNIPESGMFVGVEGARRAVRRQVYNGADVIKLIASGRVGSNAYSMPWDTELTQEEMTAVCDEAHRWGKRVAAHAYSAQSVAMCAIAGVDSIEHGALVDEPTIALMAERGVSLVPTMTAFHSYLGADAGRALPGLPAGPGPANGPAPAGPLPGVHGLRAEHSYRLGWPAPGVAAGNVGAGDVAACRRRYAAHAGHPGGHAKRRQGSGPRGRHRHSGVGQESRPDSRRRRPRRGHSHTPGHAAHLAGDERGRDCPGVKDVECALGNSCSPSATRRATTTP